MMAEVVVISDAFISVVFEMFSKYQLEFFSYFPL